MHRIPENECENFYTLSGSIGKVVASHAEVARLQDRIPAVDELWMTYLYYARKRSGGGTSQLDLPSLTPLSVAYCGRL